MGCGRIIGKTGFILPEIGFDLKEFIDPIPHRHTNLHTQATSFIAVKAQIKRIFDFLFGERCTFAENCWLMYTIKHLAFTVHVARKIYKIKATNTILVRTELFVYVYECVCVSVDLFLPKEINGMVMVRLVGKRSKR